MSVALLDVNVLIAPFDAAHNDHEQAHRWFGRNRRLGWATCPITTNGVIRVLSNPTYRALNASPEDVAQRLKHLSDSPDHHFWEDSVNLTDDSLFVMSKVGGHQKITDAYLLGLAVRNHGRLATFDKSIPTKSVVGASPSSIVLLSAVT